MEVDTLPCVGGVGQGGCVADDGGSAGGMPVAPAAGRPDWAPEGIDLNTPSVARAYDYALGGAHSFAIDREFFRAMEAAIPEARLMFRANRAFLHRAVRVMVGAGIRQFLDIGSGIPTVGNVHDIAQQAAPETRVVYVDIDPVAIAHSRLILADNDRATAIQEDFRNIDAILAHPETRELLDFSQPIGLNLVALLHAVPDADQPQAIMARLVDLIAPGSYVAISHATADSRPEAAEEAERVTKQSATPGQLRPRDEVLRFFAGLQLIEPGLVWTPQWRPDDPADVGEHPEMLVTYAGVGFKR
jgi:SAM-dependent methyltransferase